jgi:Bacterial low temperature requirement A protein (LtrA)
VTTDSRTPPATPGTLTVTENGEPPPARYLGAGGTFRLGPPRLRTTADANERRHATWFELFFDLVFVAAVSQLGRALALDPSAAVFARFAALFVVVVWAWVLYTLYANRFDTDDLIFRLAKSGAMLAIAAIAVNLHQAMDGRGGTVGFAAGYVVLRSLLIGLYVRARRHVAGPGRKLAETYIVGYSATTGLWLVSIFVPSPFRYALWTLAMVIDLTIPTRAWGALKEHSVVISHLTERHGTFFIIVLGESLVAVVAGVAGFEFTSESWIVAGVGFVISLSLWCRIRTLAGGVAHRGRMDLDARPHLPRPDRPGRAYADASGRRQAAPTGGVRRSRCDRGPRAGAQCLVDLVLLDEPLGHRGARTRCSDRVDREAVPGGRAVLPMLTITLPWPRSTMLCTVRVSKKIARPSSR